MVCTIKGERRVLWRAVDDEGVVLDLEMQRGRDKAAALKMLRKLLRNQPVKPEPITTDGLGSHGAALGELRLRRLHRAGRSRENNRAENSHLSIRRRERKQQGFKSRSSAQRFLTTHAVVQNNFSAERHLNSRSYVRQLRERAARAWKIAAA
jgi:putative transposase